MSRWKKKDHRSASRRIDDGLTLVLSDVENLCAFARFCDPAGKIWNLIEQTDDPAARELMIHEANHCPAGRLVMHDKKTGKEIENRLSPSIGMVEDPALGAADYYRFAEALY